MPCDPGCLCTNCAIEARAFACGHWNLQQYDDHAERISHDQDWTEISDGGYSRKQHRPAA